MYALISALFGRKGNSFRTRDPGRRYGWLTLAAGAGIGLGLVLALAQSFDQRDHNLKLAGFLGTVWADGWPEGQRMEEPPLKGTSAGDQPAYALLHPGTSPAELAQKKTALKPRTALKPKAKKSPAASQAKAGKAAAQKSKKEQAAKGKAKTATKHKKSPPPAATGKKTHPGANG